MAGATTRSVFAVLTTLALAAVGPVRADPKAVTWADLREARPEECADFLKTYLAQPDCAQQTLTLQLLPERFAQCSPGNSALDGQAIRIAGFAHPLEFAFRDVQAFLLIPLLRQDCRHPPPPLPDQVIFVEYPPGLAINADPVWITGVLRVRQAQTHMASTSYVLEAESVTPAVIPDVPEGG